MIKNRLGRRHAINFANTGHKAELTIQILREFSAFGDRSFKVEYFFGAPHVTRISLSKENRIWEQLAKYKKQIMGITNGK